MTKNIKISEDLYNPRTQKFMENKSLFVLQELLQTAGGVQQDDSIPIDHFFSDGLYARKMTMPAGALLVGKEHKQAHLAILLKGQVAVHSKQGECIYAAPYIVNVLPGDKRAFYSVTEVEWMTIHATEETDINIIESTLVGD